MPTADRVASYPFEVHHRIRSEPRAGFAEAARELGACVDVVSIQHSFGIWSSAADIDGEPQRDDVIEFMRAMDLPTTATLHEVPRLPTPRQRETLTELTARLAAIVVLSRTDAARVAAAYGGDPDRIVVIPHGVPDVPILDAAALKPALGVAGRDVLLSFGLLTPRKGIELVLEALPKVVAARPDTLYMVVGATHPDEQRAHGEAYRESLAARVAALGLVANVQFVDRFVGRVELIRWLQAADLVLTPYADLDQSAAGSLDYAMAMGRAIVSTPYAYADEVLGDWPGVMVPRDSAAVAAAIVELLGNHARRAELGRRAHEQTRAQTWTNVAGAYSRLFERLGGKRPLPSRTRASRLAAPA